MPKKRRKSQRRSSQTRPVKPESFAGIDSRLEGKGGSEVGGPFDGDLWDALRQGARNVAGVRYQLLVTAHLLAESRRGALPFVEVIPEGYEDIDCVDEQSHRWLVQTKEIGAGAGTFTASSVAEVISHAAQAASRPSRIVAVTDAQLGSQVPESGWDQAISQTEGFDTKSVIGALVRRGHSRTDAEELLDRSHLVRVPWNTTPMTTQSLSSCYSISPAVAAIMASRLVEGLMLVAANQRLTTVDRPGRRDLNDLDALLEQTLAVVDIEALNSAVLLGVCEIADYSAEPATEKLQFLLGVDVVPSHIAANFDVIRPGPTRAVQLGLSEGRYVVLAGPSGAGKSAQMWRSARDFARGARVVRVNRLETDNDVNELLRYVQLLEPGDISPVVVCCDDLGRPRTARWPLAAARLLERPGVLLIGAVRHEDFTAELLRRGGELVTLSLDDASAISIAEQLAFAGVPLSLEVAEAMQKAEGQLMEYVALLTTGKRMRSVLSAQAEFLLELDDSVPADIARLVCASHVLGVSIATSSLEKAVVVDRPSLNGALRRLQDEHIVTSDDRSSWQGLHQRRSDMLTDLLHETPPPGLQETFAAVLLSVDSAALGWSLRRLTELFPGVSADQVEAVKAGTSRCTNAEELAILLEALERADHSVTANAYIPVLGRYRSPQLPLLTWSGLVCSHKLAGVTWDSEGESILSTLSQRVIACSDDLPERSKEYCDIAVAACVDRIVSLSTAASLEDAVRLLEVAAPYTQLSSSDLRQLASDFPWPGGVINPKELKLHARLRAAAHLASPISSDFADAWGSVEQRLYQAAQSHSSVVSASLEEDETLSAMVKLLAHPAPELETFRFPWDLEPSQRRGTDIVNDNAVELATLLGEFCPELEFVEVVTILASGDRFTIGDLEPGHKRLGGNARPRRDIVRINVGVQAAISRQAAAYSWSELVRLRTRIAIQLEELTREAPRRVGANDHPGRRMRWLSELDRAQELLAVLPRPPAAAELDLGKSAAAWDAERDEDKLTGALRSAADALSLLVPQNRRQLVLIGAGKQIRDAARKLDQALTDTSSLTTVEEREAYLGLREHLNRLGDLLVARAYDPKLAGRLKGNPSQLADTVNELIQAATEAQLNGEREKLEEAFESVTGAVVHQIGDEDPFITSIARHQWLVTVPPESWTAVESVGAEQESGITDVPVSVVCEVDGTMVPIAVRLSTMFPTGLLPLAPDTVEFFAAALGKSTVAGSVLELVGAVTQELVLASWENARAKLRPTDWPAPDGDPHRHLTAALRSLDEAGSQDQEVLEPLHDLASRVESELEGDLRRPVSAELAGSDIFESRAVAEDHALSQLSKAVVLAIDVELSRDVAE